MVKSFPEDKVGLRLQELGFTITDYKATTSPYDREILAKVFVKDNTEITYNYQEGDTSTLIICYCRSLKRKPGLSSAFGAVTWFLNFLKNENVGVERVTCTVKELENDYENPLPPSKIIRFCTQIVGGRIISSPTLIPWYILELKDFTGLKFPKKALPAALQSSLSSKK